MYLLVINISLYNKNQLPRVLMDKIIATPGDNYIRKLLLIKQNINEPALTQIRETVITAISRNERK